MKNNWCALVKAKMNNAKLMSTKKYFKKFVKSLMVPKSLLEIKLKRCAVMKNYMWKRQLICLRTITTTFKAETSCVC